MNDEIVDNVLLDPHYDSYTAFWDKQWGETMLQRADKSPLRQPVRDFVALCRYSSEAHRLPWLAVELIRSYAEGEMKGLIQFRDQYSDSVVRKVVQRIEKEMSERLDHHGRKTLNHAVRKIEKETFGEAKQKFKLHLDAKRFWDYLIDPTRLIDGPEPSAIIPMSIFGIQRNIFLGLFFAYEDLSLHVIKSKDPTFKVEPKKGTKDAITIESGLNDNFGGTLGSECWDEEVDLTRLVRNQLVHNGGRYHSKLDKYKAKGRFFTEPDTKAHPVLKNDMFLVVTDKIQILPGNTRHLFNVLKVRALKMIDKAA
jgi:hypothetical protein